MGMGTFSSPLASSRSNTLPLIDRSFSIGIWTRDSSPRHHNSAPAQGGVLWGMGGWSFPSMNIACTRAMSELYDTSSPMCFFSSSSCA